MKTALVIGATGLVGAQLVDQLLGDARFGEVRIFVRRPTGLAHAKLKEFVIDFDVLEPIAKQIQGDVLFSTLGTTLAQAGSKTAQYKVDYTYQYEFAALAAGHGVPAYVLISSGGANASSMAFYMRMKGELERALQALPFRHIHILQPGFLDGPRPKPRPGEGSWRGILKVVNAIGLLRSARPIQARIVARAMIAVAFDESAKAVTYKPEELFALGGA